MLQYSPDGFIIGQAIIDNEMKSEIVTINDVLEEVEHLDMNDQEYVVDILSKRLIESRRAEISKRIKEATLAYKKGKVKSGSLDDMWKDLND